MRFGAMRECCLPAIDMPNADDGLALDICAVEHVTPAGGPTRGNFHRMPALCGCAGSAAVNR
jgi:hypothetical protein